MEIKILASDDVIQIHDDVILQSGGLPGFGGNRSLDAALKRIENHTRYGEVVNIYEMGALYAFALAQGHVFNDGNKRTAMTTMVNFFELNGIDLKLTNYKIENMMLDIAEKKITISEVAVILKKSSI